MKRICAQPLWIIFLLLLIVGTALWQGGTLAVLAAPLTAVTDTLSDSKPSAGSNHTIAYTAPNTVTANQTIKIRLDPDTDAFNLSTLAVADLSTVGMTLVTSCTAAGSEVTAAIDATAPDENVTFTVCTGDTVTAGAKTVTLGGTKITNPTTAGSYRIRIEGTATDAGETRVAIVEDVSATLTINPTLAFTIEGVAQGQPNANGESGTTSVGTTATSIPFGTLAPKTAKTAQQKLTISTNANNGFVVTLTATTFTNGTDDIDWFKDGAASSVPVAWSAPSGSAQQENTHGHLGITSEDADLNGDEFGTALYAGNIASARQVFSHSGPADGATVHQGTTRLGYKAQITGLQNSGVYTMTFMFIATPTY